MEAMQKGGKSYYFRVADPPDDEQIQQVGPTQAYARAEEPREHANAAAAASHDDGQADGGDAADGYVYREIEIDIHDDVHNDGDAASLDVDVELMPIPRRNKPKKAPAVPAAVDASIAVGREKSEAELWFDARMRAKMSAPGASADLLWYHRFATAEAIPHDMPGRAETVTKYAQDFVAEVGATSRFITSEMNLDSDSASFRPSPALGGMAGGEKRVVGGIMYKVCVDKRLAGSGKYLYSNADEPSDELAAKAAGHDIRGATLFMRAARDCGVQDRIRVPFQVVVDQMGFRIVAMPWLPVSDETLVYGSPDAGATVLASDAETNAMMSQMGACLHLRPHLVCDSGVQLAAAGDIEVHAPLADGNDDDKSQPRLMLDLARCMPPEDDRLVASHLRASGNTVLFRQLRPELLATWKAEGRPALNPDALTGFGRSDPAFREHCADVSAATRFLLDTVVPRFANHLLENEVRQHELVTLMHHHGINARHIGLVRKCVRALGSHGGIPEDGLGMAIGDPVEKDSNGLDKDGNDDDRVIGAEDGLDALNLIRAGEASDTLATEAVKRTLKSLLRARLRSTVRQRPGERANDFELRMTAVRFLNLVVGSVVDPAASKEDNDESVRKFWRDFVVPGVEQRFGPWALRGIVSDAEQASELYKHDVVKNRLEHIVTYILTRTSLTLSCSASASTFCAADVQTAAPSLSVIPFLATSQGELFLEQAQQMRELEGARDRLLERVHDQFEQALALDLGDNGAIMSIWAVEHEEYDAPSYAATKALVALKHNRPDWAPEVLPDVARIVAAACEKWAARALLFPQVLVSGGATTLEAFDIVRSAGEALRRSDDIEFDDSPLVACETLRLESVELLYRAIVASGRIGRKFISQFAEGHGDEDEDEDDDDTWWIRGVAFDGSFRSRVSAGATPDELLKLDSGGSPRKSLQGTEQQVEGNVLSAMAEEVNIPFSHYYDKDESQNMLAGLIGAGSCLAAWLVLNGITGCTFVGDGHDEVLDCGPQALPYVVSGVMAAVAFFMTFHVLTEIDAGNIRRRGIFVVALSFAAFVISIASGFSHGAVLGRLNDIDESNANFTVGNNATIAQGQVQVTEWQNGSMWMNISWALAMAVFVLCAYLAKEWSSEVEVKNEAPPPHWSTYVTSAALIGVLFLDGWVPQACYEADGDVDACYDARDALYGTALVVSFTGLVAATVAIVKKCGMAFDAARRGVYFSNVLGVQLLLMLCLFVYVVGQLALTSCRREDPNDEVCGDGTADLTLLAGILVAPLLVCAGLAAVYWVLFFLYFTVCCGGCQNDD